MITGYNTDVRYSELVLHVQTEDKGLGNPFIESLIYVGGRVLVAKRVGYADLLSGGSGEKEIIALMDRQHRTMIAAIRGGKFDDKLASLRAEVVGGDATLRSSSAVAVPAPGAPPPTSAMVEPGEMERTLDQVILEYLTSEAEQEQLALLIENSSELASGASAAVTLLARSSRSGTAVPGTAVTVRMISTADEPRILAEGKTGYDGQLHIEFDIPHLERGTSALIISAVSDIGRAEVKQLL